MEHLIVGYLPNLKMRGGDVMKKDTTISILYIIIFLLIILLFIALIN